MWRGRDAGLGPASAGRGGQRGPLAAAGTCTNSTADDCVLPSGEIVSDCEVAADQWVVNDPSKPHCPHTSHTTRRPATTAPGGGSGPHRNCSSPLCELIKDRCGRAAPAARRGGGARVPGTERPGLRPLLPVGPRCLVRRPSAFGTPGAALGGGSPRTGQGPEEGSARRA